MPRIVQGDLIFVHAAWADQRIWRWQAVFGTVQDVGHVDVRTSWGTKVPLAQRCSPDWEFEDRSGFNCWSPAERAIATQMGYRSVFAGSRETLQARCGEDPFAFVGKEFRVRSGCGCVETVVALAVCADTTVRPTAVPDLEEQLPDEVSLLIAPTRIGPRTWYKVPFGMVIS